MVSRRTLRFIRGLLICGQLAAIAVTVLVIVRVVGRLRGTNDAQPTREVGTSEVKEDHATDDDLPPLEWYQPLWTRDLRQPPIERVASATPAPTPAPKPPPRLPCLQGTFVEGNRAWAHLITPDGSRCVLKMSESLEGYVLVAVEPRRAELQYGNRSYWIEMPREDSIIQETP